MTANDFRVIALGLRGAVEGAHMGHPDFRINNKVFASLHANLLTGTVKLTPDAQQRFTATDPAVFVPAAGAWGRQGWTVVHLALADAEAVGDSLTLAWQLVEAATSPKATSRKRPVQAPGTPIDDYIADARPDVQPILQRIRAIVLSVAPDAEEKISYRMPAFFLDGALLYYAPFKGHIGIFPPVKGDAALAKQLEPYRGEKGNLRFPLDRRMPYGLIRRVVQARLREHKARLASPRRRS